MSGKNIDLDDLVTDHLYVGMTPAFEEHEERTRKHLIPSVTPEQNDVFDDEIMTAVEEGASIESAVESIIDSAYPAGESDIIDYLREDLHELAPNASREEIDEVTTRAGAEYYDELIRAVTEYVQNFY